MTRIKGHYSGDRHSHANWLSGHDAYYAGESFAPNEHLDWISGYRFAEQAYRRDWWACAIAGTIATLLIVGVVAFAGAALWMA
jgi:hypothetical protein